MQKMEKVKRAVMQKMEKVKGAVMQKMEKVKGAVMQKMEKVKRAVMQKEKVKGAVMQKIEKVKGGSNAENGGRHRLDSTLKTLKRPLKNVLERHAKLLNYIYLFIYFYY